MPADTPTPLNLNDRVPCAFCGGEFVWTTFDGDDEWPANAVAACRCGAMWEDVPTPVTWRTLATSGEEVPAAYVARLVGEVERLTAERTTPGPRSPPMPADPKPYSHRRDDLDGNAHCRCGVMSIHDPVVGATWGRNCPPPNFTHRSVGSCSRAAASRRSRSGAPSSRAPMPHAAPAPRRVAPPPG